MRSHLLLTSLSEELASSLAPLASLDLMKSLALLLALPMEVSDLLGVFLPLSCAGLLNFSGSGAEVLAPAYWQLFCLELARPGEILWRLNPLLIFEFVPKLIPIAGTAL